MATAANGNNLSIGRGKFYFDRFDPATGLPTGLRRFVGEADKGDISISSTNKTRYTKTKATNNKILSVDVDQTHTIALDLMEFTSDNVSLALLGEVIDFVPDTTPVTAETLAVVYLAGDIYQLKGRNPVSLALTATSGPLVLGTDYEFEDQKLGLIRMLTQGTTLRAAYTPGATDLSRIAAGQNTAIYGQLIFVGDPTIGPEYDLEIWKVKFMSAGVFSLLSDDPNKISLTGEILDDTANHPDSPLYQLTYRPSGAIQGTSITFSDTVDGHTYILTVENGFLIVTEGDDGAPSATLNLADTTNGLDYAVTTISGALTLTEDSGSGAVDSVTFTDMLDGQTYLLTSVNGVLTVTQE